MYTYKHILLWQILVAQTLPNIIYTKMVHTHKLVHEHIIMFDLNIFNRQA